MAASILGYVLPSTIYLKCNEIEFRQALYGDSGNSNHCGIESSKNEVYNSIRCDSIVNNDDSTTYNNNHTDDIEMVDTLFTHTKHAMSSNYPNNNGKDGKSNADDGDDDDEVCEIEFTSIRIPSDDDHPVNKGTSRWNLLNSNYNYYFQTDNNSGQYRIITAAEELVQSILQLKKFYLPLFMIVFGFLSLFIGVITIIVENV